MKDYDPLGMTPYHGPAGAIVNAGGLVMLAFALLGVPHPWIGFFVGAAPVFLLFAWVLSKEEDHDGNHGTEGECDD